MGELDKARCGSIDQLSHALEKESRDRAKLDKSCRGRFDQLSRTLEKESQDRVELEESVFKAMCMLQALVENIDGDAASCTEEALEGLDRECHEHKQDSNDLKSGAAELRVDVEKAYKLALDNKMASLSQELKVEGEARQTADKKIMQELEDQRLQLDEIARKFHLKNTSAECSTSPRVSSTQKERLEYQQTQLDYLFTQLYLQNAKQSENTIPLASSGASSSGPSESSNSPRSLP